MNNSHHKSIVLISTLMIIIAISIVFIYYLNNDSSSYFSPITSSNIGTQEGTSNVIITFSFIIIVLLGFLIIKTLK